MPGAPATWRPRPKILPALGRAGGGGRERSGPSAAGAAATGERPFLDVLSDRRFWLIHSAAVSGLFAAGAFSVAAGLGGAAARGRGGAALLADRFLELRAGPGAGR